MALKHWITLGAIAILVTGVVGFQVHVGMGAFAAAALLTLAKAADERPAIQAIPWGVIVMVCGVTVLTSLLEKTGGIDLFTTILARFATHRSVTGLIALVTGLMSVYSSTSGVVLPALLPSVPGLVAKLGGGNPLAIASSILIGGHLVDVSPLSTIGALCIASAPASADRRLLFNQVLAWGLSMSVVGRPGATWRLEDGKVTEWRRRYRCCLVSSGHGLRAFRRPSLALTADGRQSGLAGSPEAPGRGASARLA